VSSLLLFKNINVKLYKTIILTVIIHGCEICSLTLREEYILRVSENRVLRRTFGLKME